MKPFFIKIFVEKPIFGSDGLPCSSEKFNCSDWERDDELAQKQNCAKLLSRILKLELIDNSSIIPFEAPKHGVIESSINMSYVKFVIEATKAEGGGSFHCSNGSLLAPADIAVLSTESSTTTVDKLHMPKTTSRHVYKGIHQLWSREITVVKKDSLEVVVVNSVEGQPLVHKCRADLRYRFKISVIVGRIINHVLWATENNWVQMPNPPIATKDIKSVGCEMWTRRTFFDGDRVLIFSSFLTISKQIPVTLSPIPELSSVAITSELPSPTSMNKLMTSTEESQIELSTMVRPSTTEKEEGRVSSERQRRLCFRETQ